jgi:hypothetical protein
MIRLELARNVMLEARSLHLQVQRHQHGAHRDMIVAQAEQLRCRTEEAFASIMRTWKYDNLEEGVRQYLHDEDVQIDFRRAQFRQDPSIDGVWLVQCVGGMNIVVYLAGYPDAMRTLRTENDFETSL